MSFRINLELIFDEKTAYFIHEYQINLAQIAVEATIHEIARQNDIRKVITARPADQELEDLKRALTQMRAQRDEARTALAAPDRRGVLRRLF